VPKGRRDLLKGICEIFNIPLFTFQRLCAQGLSRPENARSSGPRLTRVSKALCEGCRDGDAFYGDDPIPLCFKGSVRKGCRDSPSSTDRGCAIQKFQRLCAQGLSRLMACLLLTAFIIAVAEVSKALCPRAVATVKSTSAAVAFGSTFQRLCAQGLSRLHIH
jgi:hypothetical protein